MYEINTIKFDVNEKTTYIKCRENATHIIKCEWEFNGGCPIIGVYDTTFNVITIPDFIDRDMVDGIEYVLIYIYDIRKVR